MQQRIYISGLSQHLEKRLEPDAATKAHTKNRFLAKVSQQLSGCWNWVGGTDRKGYGKFSMGNSRNPDGTRRNSMVSAHRAAYEMFIGPIPAASGFHGTCVLHKCDNPSCVNPEHLFLGSNADNIRDMCAKGRHKFPRIKGAAHANAKLSSEQVLEIKRRIGNGDTQTSLAKEYCVCLATVNHIKTGRLWGHLNAE